MDRFIARTLLKEFRTKIILKSSMDRFIVRYVDENGTEHRF